MPALPSVPKVLRLDHFFHIGEDLAGKCRTFWNYLTGPPTDSDLAAMAIGLKAAFATDMASLFNAGVSLVELVITDLTSPTSAIGSESTPVPGTRSGGSVGADQCVLESRHVARRYRGGHSRIYWPMGTPNDLADAQTWTDAMVAAADAGLSAYDAAIATQIATWGSSGAPVAVSYYSGFTVHTGTTGRARNVSTVRSVPLVDLVTGGGAQKGVATQRKRLLALA